METNEETRWLTIKDGGQSDNVVTNQFIYKKINFLFYDKPNSFLYIAPKKFLAVGK
jgi:hypothetical protein